MKFVAYFLLLSSVILSGAFFSPLFAKTHCQSAPTPSVEAMAKATERHRRTETEPSEDIGRFDYDAVLKDAYRKANDLSLLQTKEGSFDPLRTGLPGLSLPALDARLFHETEIMMPAMGVFAYRIVQFREKLTPKRIKALQHNGFQAVGYLPNNALIVAYDKAINDPDFGDGVRFSGEIPSSWKLDPRLRRALFEGDFPKDEELFVKITGFKPETMKHWARFALAAGASDILYQSDKPSARMMLLVLPEKLFDVTLAFARVSGVSMVRLYELPVFMNYGSTWLLQSGDPDFPSTPLFDVGLTGFGQVYAAADSGLDTDACQFRYSEAADDQTFAITKGAPRSGITNPENKVIAYYTLLGSKEYDETSGKFHGTMTTGCAAGDNYLNLATIDDPGVDRSDGMAPAAQIVFQDAGNETGYLVGLAFTSLYSLNQQAYDSGARVHNNSYGLMNPSLAYDGDSMELDAFCYEYNEHVIVFSAGNSGSELGTLTGEGSTAKNTIVVGATTPGWYENGDDLLSFSSCGPTADGRIKPDLVAPGLVESAAEIESNPLGKENVDGNPAYESVTDPPNNQCAVRMTSGTSFSAPTAAGMALLARQYFTDGFYPNGERNYADSIVPSSALIRAVMLNSGQPLGGDVVSFHGEAATKRAELTSIPSPQQGFGRITLNDALYFKGDKRDLIVFADIKNNEEDTLTEGEEDLYTFYAKPGEKLKATLVWIDPYPSEYAEKALVNDLDLSLRSPSGALYRGNINFDSGFSIPAGSTTADRINPQEQVFLEAPEEGEYTITVHAASLPGQGTTATMRQGYALIVTGDLGEEENNLLPRISMSAPVVDGGCDADAYLDKNETVTLRFEIMNSGDGDSGSLSASMRVMEDESEIDIEHLSVMDEAPIAIGRLVSHSRSNIALSLGLSDFQEDACMKRIAIAVDIEEDDEIIYTKHATLMVETDETDYGVQQCQEIECNPPATVERIDPNQAEQGQYFRKMRIFGSYFTSETSIRFDPDVISADEVDVPSPSEIEFTDVKIADDAPVGFVDIYVRHGEMAEVLYEAMFEVLAGETNDAPSVADGDAAEDDTDAEIGVGSGGGGGCHSATDNPSPFIFLSIALLIAIRRKVLLKYLP